MPAMGTRIFPLGTGIDWIPMGTREHGNKAEVGNTSGFGNNIFALGSLGDTPFSGTVGNSWELVLDLVY